MSASRKKVESSLRRWGLILLAAALLCTFWPGNPYRAYAADTDGAIAYLYHKDSPLVEVQGNIVEDNGVPTGFYELALCVQTKYYTSAEQKKPISQKEYDLLSDADKAGYTPHNAGNFSFQSVAASLKINTDVLTPVRWDAAYPEYASWDSDAKKYNMNEYDATMGRTTHFARGLDLTKADITNIRGADYHSQVRLDTAKPDEVNAATALVEHYADETDTTAILTLSATAPTAGVVYDEMTPVVVVRFAYDKARFADARNDFGVWENTDRTGAPSYTDLVTYLSADDEAAKSSVNQSVWFQAGLEANEDPTTLPPDYTMFYYYQGANYGTTQMETVEGGAQQPKKEMVSIRQNTGGAIKRELVLPATAGRTVLTEDAAEDSVLNKYSFMKNLLRTTWVTSESETLHKTLYFERVHQETYRKPTGGTGGTQILFYDWDDTLIGSLIVDKGDVRAEVNDYLESRMVHPDIQTQLAQLRTALGGNLKNIDDPSKETDPGRSGLLKTYKDLLDSIDRKDTYRGKYSSDPAAANENIDDNGGKYPLTNKLDYAFYRRVNTVTTAEDGTKYYTAQSVSADESSALYPYVYGWAIVEDEDVKTAEDWYLRRETVKTQDVWTTFGGGELSSVTAEYNRPGPGADANRNEMPDAAKTGTVSYPGGLAKVPACAAAEATASLQSVDAVSERVEAPLEAEALTPEIPLGEEALVPEEVPGVEDAPEGMFPEDAVLPEDVPAEMLADTPAVKVPSNYYFHTSAKDGNDYLKFADFSNVDAMLAIPGSTEKKSVLIVKAVYEQGTSLQPDYGYRVVDDSLRVQRYSTTASTNNATYSFQYQYERATMVGDAVIGVGRVREPGVQTGMTYDVEEFGQDNNPNQVFYIKNITTNTDIMDVDLTASGTIWRLSYILVDLFDRNIATGVVRSAGEELKLSDNFAYTDELPYEDRQGTEGFVIQATMNTLLKEASAAARGEAGSLANNFDLDTVQDLNLREDEDGTPYDGFSNYGACAQYLQELVTKMYQHKDTHPEYFDKYGNAVLTWHQLQREIIMRNAGAGSILDSNGTLLSNEECAGFDWCRLCTEDTDACKNKEIVILTYGDMFRAIAVKDSQPDTYEQAINKWKESASTFDFRKDKDGTPYYMGTDAAKEAFLDRMEMAYGKLVGAGIAEPRKASWKVVQEILITETYNSTPTFNYWWGPEGTPPAIESWDDLLKRAIQEYIGVEIGTDGNGDKVIEKLPGAFAGFDETDLKTLVSVHKEGQPANLGWFRNGTNAADDVAIEFTVDEFKTALEKALTALINDGHYAATVDGIKSASWEEIQYALLAAMDKYPGEPAYKNLTQINGDGYDYWWKDGGKPKLTYEKFRPTLWDHALNGPDRSQAVDLITSIAVVNDQLRFRADEYGGEFTSTEQFQERLYTVLRNATRLSNRSDFMNDTNDDFDMTWEELQWLLIYGETVQSTTVAPSDENNWTVDGVQTDPATAFWWEDPSGTPPKVPIRVTTVSALVQGAKWTWTLPAVNDQALRGDSLVSEITALHLRKANGVPYTDKTEFLTDMEAAYTALVSGLSANKVTTATWAEVQYALIYKTFKSEAAIRADAAVDFWWENGGTPAITDMASLMKAAWYYGKGATDALTGISADGMLDWINDSKDPLIRLRQNNEGAKWGTTKLNDLKNQLTAASVALTTSGAPYTPETLGNATWEEIQYAVINEAYMSNDDIQAAITAGTISYWWKTDDVKPGGEAQEKEITGNWEDFMKNVSLYICGTSKDKSKLGTYLGKNPVTVNDDYLLRKDESGSEFGAWEDFTALMELIKSNVIKSGGAVFQEGEYDPDNTTKNLRLKLGWWQFQYALLHCNETDWAGRKFPTESELKNQAPYEWKIQQPPRQLEITGNWEDFMKNVSLYICGTSKDKSKLGTYLGKNPVTVNDDYLLRKDESGSEFGAWEDFTALMELIKSNVIKSGGAVFQEGEYDPDNTTKNLRLKLGWWQFQYALLHCNETDWAGRKFPTEQEIQDKLAENNYTWKFVDGYSGETPTTTSKALSAPPPQQAVMWLPEAVSDCMTKLRAGMAAVAA